jgi:hypothetical protein
MVLNLNMVLDEGENKILTEVKMTTNQVEAIHKLILGKSREKIKRPPVWDSDEEEYIDGDNEMDNPNYKRPTPIINKWLKDLDKKMWDAYALDCGWKTYAKHLKAARGRLLDDTNYKRKLYDYLDIIPFNPCVMINISPAWKGEMDPRSEAGQTLLADTIQNYLNSCQRYTKWKYCLECGGDGDFLHAHIVAEINPKLEKSVKTHINKGNHKYELIKSFKKFGGCEGLLKGKFSVQRIMLNSIELRDDKLKYLEEQNKPEGHKNAYDLDLVLGDF